MKNLTSTAIFTGLFLSLCLPLVQAQNQDQGNIYDSLRSQMERACPSVWEDLGANMDAENLNGDIWGSTGEADRNSFISLMQEIMTSATSDQILAMADDVATVATECASHRVALLDALISKTPRDVLLAMDAVNKGLNKSVEYLDGGWSVGDVRVTGRLQPQDGWVFLVGQTVGSESSSATLKGEEFNELFELAKNWAPNNGNEDWAAGHLVTLPDMRGRSIVAADNMGGSSKNVSTANQADVLGGVYGKEKTTLAIANLPSHKHSLSTTGSHSHPTGYAGNHTHNLRTSGYVGSNNPGTFEYGGQLKGRWEYAVTTTKSVVAAGNHKHSISNAGNHTHSVGNTGSGQAVETTQPNIVFNVEMKY